MAAPGREGAAHPQRGPRPRAASRCAPNGASAASAKARRDSRIQTGGHVRAKGDRSEGHQLRLRRRPPDRPRLHHHHLARRQDRHHRPERRRQDHPAQTAAGPTRAGIRRGEARHATCRSSTSTSCAARSTTRRPSRKTSRATPRRSLSRAARATSTAISRISSSAPTASACPRRCSPAASATGCCSPGFSCSRPTCWCWTSRPTISMPRRWSCWRNCWSNTTGTLLLVSHDRAFLDNVVTSTLVFEGDGQHRRIHRRLRGLDAAAARSEPLAAQEKPAAKPAPTSGKAASQKISQSRAARAGRNCPGKSRSLRPSGQPAGKLEDPALYQKGHDAPREVREQMAVLEKVIHERYARWEELEKLRESLGSE